MKIIILRHAERYESPQYFTPLTINGLMQADKMITELPADIDCIYCSPFLRTIQTIFPYCKQHNKKIVEKPVKKLSWSEYKKMGAPTVS